MISRLKRSKLIDKIAIATSNNPIDDRLQQFCNDEDITCFRGSENNVLERFAECAALFPKADHIIRVTGDCPLIDPNLLDDYIKDYLHLRPNIDSYHLGSPNYPRGLDAEIFPSDMLKHIAIKATTNYQKEHVTPYIYQNPDQFTPGIFESNKDHSDQRWCVDEEADFLLVQEIFKRLYPENPNFTWRDILHLLDEHPELKRINQHVRQKNT